MHKIRNYLSFVIYPSDAEKANRVKAALHMHTKHVKIVEKYANDLCSSEMYQEVWGAFSYRETAEIATKEINERFFN